MRLDILRNRREPEGTFGILSVDGEPFGVTCEQKWLDNQPFVSCIPAGDYDAIPWDSAKYGPVIALVNHALRVFANDADAPRDGKSHRYSCLIHAANWPRQLQGCVAPGRAVQFFHAKDEDGGPLGWGVTESRRTLERLRSRWKDRKNITVSIRWSEEVRPHT